MVASSSRRSVAKAGLVALLGLSATATLAELLSTRQRTAKPRARLWVRRGEASEVAKDELSSESLARAAWLCSATLPGDALLEILNDIGQLLDTLEARANPFALDLSDESAPALERRLSRMLLPIWSAARAFSAPGWRTGDGAFRVSIGTGDGMDPPGVEAFELWSTEARASMPESARFAAWAVTGSCLRLAGAERRAALKARVLRPDSAVALVIDSFALDVSIEQVLNTECLAAVVELRERARRLEPGRLAQRGATGELLRAFASPLPRAPLLGWLELRKGEVLVVPKLRFAARPERLVDELRTL